MNHEGIIVGVSLVVDAVQILRYLPQTYENPVLLVAGQPTSDKEIVIKVVADYLS